MSLLEKIFGPAIKFFGILASSLTGITAIFSAIGFLAERSHLVMLGFSGVPIDINQYLYTGARFFAYLPFLFLYTLFFNLLELLKQPAYLAVFFSLFGLLILWRLFRSFKFIQRLSNSLKETFKKSTARVKGILLFLLLCFQFAAVVHLFEAVNISNLLFPNSTNATNPGMNNIFFVDHATITQWILHKENEALIQYMGWLLIIFIVTLLLLYLLSVTVRKKGSVSPTTWQSVWLVANLIILFTQFLLLPINFGILLMPNQYPGVKVVLNSTQQGEMTFPMREELVILNHQAQDIYLYSPTRARVWMIKRDDIAEMEILPLRDIFDGRTPVP